MNSNLYLEPSPIPADGGFDVGRLPGSIDLRDLRDLHHPESPIRAIRAKCIDCSGGVATEARKCVAIGCPLWPFRTGDNPFRKPASDKQRANAAKATAVRMGRSAENEHSRRRFSEKTDRPGTIPHPGADRSKTSKSEGRS